MSKYGAFIAFLIMILLTACHEDCGITSEPKLVVDFTQNQQLPAYSRVYGLGGNGKSIPFDAKVSNIFPISLLADSSVYIFEAYGQKNDTLVIGYHRSLVEFQIKRCGFTMQLDNVRLLPSTTFQQAQLSSSRTTRNEPFNYEVVIY